MDHLIRNILISSEQNRTEKEYLEKYMVLLQKVEDDAAEYYED